MSRGEKRETEIRAVRAALTLRGDSLHAWAARHGFHDAYVHLVLRGLRRGARAQAILAAIRRDGLAA